MSSNEPPNNHTKSKIIMITLIAAAVVALTAGGLMWFYSGQESTDDAFIEGHVIPIAPRVAGPIVKVYVLDNQRVKKDDLLYEIDPRDYQTKLQEDQARVAAAGAEAARAAADARRYAALFRNDEVSKQQLDQARTAARSSEAMLQRAQAEAQQAALDLSYTQARAPESGLVTRKSVEEGSYVQVGQSLFAIVPEEVWVIANFKETQLTRMKPGQSVTISVDAYPDHLFKGHVDSVQSGTGERFSLLPPENATGNYVKVVQRVPVKIVFDEPTDSPYHLAPGMSVEPTVKIK